MRRVLPLAILMLAMLPATASAAAWHSFKSSSDHFSVQYPPNWQVSPVNTSSVRETLFSARRSNKYSLTVFDLLKVKPGSTIRATLANVKKWQRKQHDTSLNRITWTSTEIGGQTALFGVIRPSTEGGVALAQGTYLTSWRGHVFEIEMATYSKKAPTSPSQFPAIYHLILRTWRFR